MIWQKLIGVFGHRTPKIASRTRMTSEVKGSQHASQGAEHPPQSEQHVLLFLGSFCKPGNSYKVHMWTVHKPWWQYFVHLAIHWCKIDILDTGFYCVTYFIYWGWLLLWVLTAAHVSQHWSCRVPPKSLKSAIQWQRPRNLCGAPPSHHSLWMLESIFDCPTLKKSLDVSCTRLKEYYFPSATSHLAVDDEAGWQWVWERVKAWIFLITLTTWSLRSDWVFAMKTEEGNQLHMHKRVVP